MVICIEGSRRCGKTLLVNRLLNDEYKYPDGGFNVINLKSFNINGVEFHEMILDFPTLPWKVGLTPVTTKSAAESKVFIEAFAINDPTTLEHLITSYIPRLERRHPFILVGLRSDLRQERQSDDSLFPLEFGQCLAHLVGAVTYLECSAKLNQGVQDVFEEAIRASFQNTHCEVVDPALKTFVFSKFLRNKEPWKRAIAQVLTLPDPELILSNQILSNDERLHQAAVSTMLVSLSNVCSCRMLDMQVINLANARFNPENFRINYEGPIVTAWSTDKKVYHYTTCNITNARLNNVASHSPISLKFVHQDCTLITKFLSRHGTLSIRSLVIVSCTGRLELDFLYNVEGLEHLVVIDTSLNLSSLKALERFTTSLKTLVLQHCDQDESKFPDEVGHFRHLEVLNVSCNGFKVFPKSLRNLDKLHLIIVDEDQVLFPPKNVMQALAQDVVNFLKGIQDEPQVANLDAKLIVVGQEGVGKSTLLKSLDRSFWLWNTRSPSTTEGVDISSLQLNNFDCAVYDLAGDFEYFTTHMLFLSPNCLHLVVFDLSNLPVSKTIRSSDQFCRLEMWLKVIAGKNPHSYAIIIGTHADKNILKSDVLEGIRYNLIDLMHKHNRKHNASVQPFKDCLLCNQWQYIPVQASQQSSDMNIFNDESLDDPLASSIPHLLDYLEVSGTTNKNVKCLKLQLQKSIASIKEWTNTETIPNKWNDFKESIRLILSSNEKMRKWPILSLVELDEIAYQSGIYESNSILTMLRYFHSQGRFLWYEDIPEMKGVVVIDPQWLSNQLKKIFSSDPQRSAVLNEGVLHHSLVPLIWSDLAEDSLSKLISLFRNMRLCFSLSDEEELFPCKLPIGWPDCETWPSKPKPTENEISVFFLFSFLPPSFFPELTVVIDKKKRSSSPPPTVPPSYYRFNIVYITRGQSSSDQSAQSSKETDPALQKQQGQSSHKVRLEVIPYSNSIKVTIRGSRPAYMLNDVRSTIEEVRSRRYPGITYEERFVCPQCETNNVHNPATLQLDGSPDVLCSKGHNVVSAQYILAGSLSPPISVSLYDCPAGGTVCEVLEDHYCPRLFAVLPVNLDGFSLKDRYVYSYLRDGYAAHLICECPDVWHYLKSPGFRIRRPQQFFKIFGVRVCKLLRVMSTRGPPLSMLSGLKPSCKAYDVVDKGAKDFKALLDDYMEKFPHLKPLLGSSEDDLQDLKSSQGLKRSELARLLEVAAKGKHFGSLTCTYVEKFNEWLWLCEEHIQKYKNV